jgi:hypothetical protein
MFSHVGHIYTNTRCRWWCRDIHADYNFFLARALANPPKGMVLGMPVNTSVGNAPEGIVAGLRAAGALGRESLALPLLWPPVLADEVVAVPCFFEGAWVRRGSTPAPAFADF